MCSKLFTAALKSWVQLSNLLIMIMGLVASGFGIYMAAKVSTPFTGGIIVIGLVTVVVGIVGLSSVGKKSRCGISFYSLLLSLLLMAHIGFLVGLMAFPEKLYGYVKEQAHESQYNEFKAFMEKNGPKVTIILGVIVAVEFFCLFFVCLYKNRMKDSSFAYASLDDTPFIEGEDKTYETPVTNALRAKYAKKYGLGGEQGSDEESDEI